MQVDSVGHVFVKMISSYQRNIIAIVKINHQNETAWTSEDKVSPSVASILSLWMDIVKYKYIVTNKLPEVVGQSFNEDMMAPQISFETGKSTKMELVYCNVNFGLEMITFICYQHKAFFLEDLRH